MTIKPQPSLRLIKQLSFMCPCLRHPPPAWRNRLRLRNRRNPLPATNASATPARNQQKTDRSAAYYHFGLAHMYEDMATNYGRPEYATRAIEEYKLALDADPNSKYLNSGLAELYLRTGRVRDAVLAAQDILKTEPNNLEAHKLLGRVYLQSLGNVQNGGPSEKVLQLAIAEYTKIVHFRATISRAVSCWGSSTPWRTTRRMRKSSLRRHSASIPIQKM